MTKEKQPHTHKLDGFKASEERYTITYGHLTKTLKGNPFRKANGFSVERIEKEARKLVTEHDKECQHAEEDHGPKRKEFFQKANAAITTTNGAWGSKILAEGLTEDL